MELIRIGITLVITAAGVTFLFFALHLNVKVITYGSAQLWLNNLKLLLVSVVIISYCFWIQQLNKTIGQLSHNI